MTSPEKIFHPQSSRMPQLLVSVRDADEAVAALTGGADIIDVKEPRRGSLGMADVSQIEAVLRVVRESNPMATVSTALGETIEWLSHDELPRLPHGLSYIKLGTAGLARDSDWPTTWRRVCDDFLKSSNQPRPPSTIHHPPRLLPVAYADWHLAESPSPNDVAQLAITAGCPGLLIDTFVKHGQRLLDWLDVRELSELAGTCHHHGLWLAMAGSLDVADLPKLVAAGPDIVGIRSAACRGRQRLDDIDAGATADFKQSLRWSFDTTRRPAALVLAGCTN
ncbi:MAG: (5-formylfuran-3-yl)methyl phosphate synthase [Planctomycetales bacterium]|nr:(5-formylfuran-3-yl)methyl phosphate synthase [Planctomycetales bacterium]